MLSKSQSDSDQDQKTEAKYRIKKFEAFENEGNSRKESKNGDGL
jgi:hypothetical protein